MESNGSNVIEANATELEQTETTTTTAMDKINTIFKMRSVRVAAAALVTVGVAAKIVAAVKNHQDEETTEEV